MSNKMTLSLHIVDTLIGIDSSQLHVSIKDVKSDSGKSIARFTPHGWTCIGNNSTSHEDLTLPIKQKNSIKEQTNYYDDFGR